MYAHPYSDRSIDDQPTLFVTMWYAKGIGLVKRENRQEYPDRKGMTVSTQELAGVTY